MNKLVKAGIIGCLVTTFAGGYEVHGPERTVHAEEAAVPAPIPYYTDKWTIVPKWNAPPVVDGILDETLWNQSSVLDGFATAYYELPLPHQVEYKAAYDEDYLYIGGTMDNAESDTLADIEIVISPLMEGDTHYVARLTVDPNDHSVTDTTWSPQRGDHTANPGRTMLTGVNYEITAAGSGVTVEAAIPLAAIVPGGAATGDEWRVNIIHVHRSLTRPLTAWVPIRHSDHWDRFGEGGRLYGGVVNQGRMGSLFFGQFPGSQASGASAAVPWILEQAELTYNGFTGKRLRFKLPGPILNEDKFRLMWKGPDSGWQQLEEFDLTKSGGVYKLDFEHPAPLKDGAYQLRLVVSPSAQVQPRAATLLFDRESMIASGLSIAPRMQGSDEPPVAVVPSAPSARVQQALSLIPEQPGYRYVGLPEMPELYPDNLYTLSADGQSLIASRTGTGYPNASFAENKEYVTTNGKGETVRIPYYEDGDGKMYFITGHLWYLQKNKALSETKAIAQTDPLGAARLLYRFAQAYEGYNPTIDQAWNYHSISRPAGPPYSYWGGMWYRWYGSDLLYLTSLFQAYSLVKKTDAFEVLSAEAGEDVEAKLLRDMFGPSLDYVLGYTVHLGNLSYTNWNGMIEAGKALNEPDYIHFVVAQMEEFMSTLFLSDGFWQEVSLSYHMELVSGIKQAADKLKGWTDPVGYISPRTGKRLVNLDMARDYPIIGKALEYQKRLVYPDGHYYPIQDTWAYTKVSAPGDSGSTLLPAAGIGRLSGGQGLDQTQLYMSFQPKYPTHIHYDPLNLGLYASRQELLPDLGYTFNTFYRWYTLSTMAHNTVVVNSRNAVVSGDAVHGGNVEAFVPQENGFQAMRASYESAYPVTEEYRREPWFVPFADGDGQQGYVLDLFRVSGGNRHEYTLQGDANRDAYFDTGMTLNDYGPYLLPPGTTVVPPVSNSDSGSAEGNYPGYIYVRDVKQAVLPADRYELTLVTAKDGSPGSKLNITGLLEPGVNELYLGRSPSLKSARLEGRNMDNNDEAVKYTLPKLVLRRDGTNLKSTFITLLEPYDGKATPRIEAIDRLQPEQAPEGAVAVKVAYGGTTDLLLSNPDYAIHQMPLVVGDVTLSGEMGLIRHVDGQVREMKLTGGTLLKKGDRELSGAGTATGTVVGTLRLAGGDDYDGILTSASVPASAAGRYVIVAHPDGSKQGFLVREVRPHGSRTLLVFDQEDPGFVVREDGSSAQTSFPMKQWTGLHTFSISNVERTEWPAGDPPAVSRAGTVIGAVYDPFGQPVHGAKVNLTGNQAVASDTGADGTYSLSGVPEGWQRVTATSPGHVLTVSDAVYVAAGQTATIPISFTKLMPPTVTQVTYVGTLVGSQVTATSSASGYVYLVPSATEPTPSALEAAAVTVGGAVYGARSAAVAGVPAYLETTGMQEGLYSIYAVDSQHQVSSGVPVILMSGYLSTVEDAHPLAKYSGVWTTLESSLMSGGSSRQTRIAGGSVDIPFYGTRAKVLSLVGSSRGKADVYLDGLYRGNIDTYSPNVKYRHEIFDTGPLPEGVHVIRIVVTGEKRPESTNTFINIDALQVTGSAPANGTD
ncbi:carboxypeptidase regulatory-like domain-containing protein [Paenibacillus oceani]|uniref:Heparinase II/III family protein n=1 Tax=Paenibacillus oceani TaxID=2772510 RepID=A0A927GZJ9_9BACL|nr:carboxypeptidase regulatory-like domain-containing protein [Paenibacillus oceani]MBD2862157.1 heparinase II/III family protein [Paenibacillus oceani]